MEREKQRRLEEVERLRQERKRREEGEADRKVRGVVKVGIYDDTNYILYYKVLGCTKVDFIIKFCILTRSIMFSKWNFQMT